MASAEQYAEWIVNNEGKKGTPEFETVAEAYKLSKETPSEPSGIAKLSPLNLAKTAPKAIADYTMGGIKGMADIGSTLLTPFDKLTGVTDRRQKIGEFFKENSSPESLPFQGGSLAMNVAGTAGAGGLLAKGAQALGAAPKVISALETGGFSLGPGAATTTLGRVGDAGLRMGAGGAVGATQAGLVNPQDAGMGAAIGAALPPAVKVAGAVGGGLKSAGEHIIGSMTGTSGETLRNAFKAGQTGSTDFLDNMRGKVDFGEIVDSAKEGLRNMRAERGRQYRSGMVNIKGDKSVLDMQPITDAVDAMKQSGNFKGKIINQKSGGVIDEMDTIVADWTKSNPKEFHTPEGLDALKQAIGDIRDSTQFGTPARRAADNVYNAIKDQIKKQAPTYDKVMGDYATASRELQEIEKALSLGDKTSKDTAIRKLQSLMRNNAQTNYGNRTNLAQTLQDKGGVDLNPAIAGQAMNTWLPRGMVGAIEKAGAVGAAALAPEALIAAPFMSPRLMGEAAYGLGRLSSGTGGLLSRQGALGGNQGASIMEDPLLRNMLLQMTTTSR